MAAIERRDADRRLVFVGDYVNRGPSSRGVVDFLMRLGGCVCCRGNHDDVFQLLTTGRMWVPEPTRVDPVPTFGGFLKTGLDATLLSYGYSALEVARLMRGVSDADVKELGERVPGSHVSFFQGLQSCHVAGTYFVAHAHWPVGEDTIDDRCAVPNGLRRGLCWTRYRDDEIDAPKRWDRPGFFGHTPTPFYDTRVEDDAPRPIFGEKLVLLDTGAFRPRGRLTAVCPETMQVVQAGRDGEVIDG